MQRRTVCVVAHKQPIGALIKEHTRCGKLCFRNHGDDGHSWQTPAKRRNRLGHAGLVAIHSNQDGRGCQVLAKAYRVFHIRGLHKLVWPNPKCVFKLTDNFAVVIKHKNAHETRRSVGTARVDRTLPTQHLNITHWIRR